MTAVISFTNPRNQAVGVFEFDAIMSETHSTSADVSEHAVEVGTNIADHVVPGLFELQLSLYVSDTPITPVRPRNVTSDSLVGAWGQMGYGTISQRLVAPLRMSGTGFTDVPFPVPGQPRRVGTPITVAPNQYEDFVDFVSGSALQFSEPMNRRFEAWRALSGLCRQGIPVHVATDIKVYPKMLITQASAPVTLETGIEFSITLREYREVTIELTQLSAKKRPRPAVGRCEAPKKTGDASGGPGTRLKKYDVRGSVLHALKHRKAP